ncbi:hypothetical protein EV421DRAFT_1721637 [Armillaria borealis]|uniref:Uncharacterized protein n=1 Tax=Armillaria borealis TaxID=47425 RepID=A0AA39ME02_9AGAR|nr:hypothetical protein EV421DRAFT_1721637 [Armillaria borealis]
MKGASLRRWLNQPDCLDVIVVFKTLFNRACSPPHNLIAEPPTSQQSNHAHYFFDHYNLLRMHYAGSNLVLYHPYVKSTTAVGGSIQKVTTRGDQVHFHIKRQAPLPLSKYNPFRRYPSFPACMYSLKMNDDLLDKVSPSVIVSYPVRFKFSYERAVILNLSKVRLIPLFLSFC